MEINISCIITSIVVFTIAYLIIRLLHRQVKNIKIIKLKNDTKYSEYCKRYDNVYIKLYDIYYFGKFYKSKIKCIKYSDTDDDYY